MTTHRAGHDPERFYHCHCLDLDGRDDHDPERFYHCDCVEEARARQEAERWEAQQRSGGTDG